MAMGGQGNKIGRLHVYGLLGVSTLALLAGCDWFGGGTSNTAKVRPGAERQVTGSGSLPSASAGRQYDAGIAPVDETRGPQIGSVVATKGGQKAQLEGAAKEAAERDKQAREAREKADKEAAERKANKPEEPPTQPTVPPPAPVTTAPVPPPPGPATDAAPRPSTLPTAPVAVAHASQDVNGPSAEADSDPAHGTNAARGVAANRRAEVLIDL
jgi:hypothetical protein